ncbi:MAG: M48 family metallopeptidase [Pseudomonadota bacterium]
MALFGNLLRIVVVLALPVGCLFWIGYLSRDGAYLLEGKEFGALCALQLLTRGAERGTECDAPGLLWYFDSLSWIALITAAAPIVLFLGSAMICGTNRWLNVAVFRRLVPVATILVVVNLLVQGALLLAALITLYLAHIGNPPLAIVGFTVVGITGAAAAVVAGAAAINVDPFQQVRAAEVTRDQAPALWELVDEIAEVLGAETPDSIVVGLEPTFWVISGRVILTGEGLHGRCQGRTLFLSMTLMRVLAMEEFIAIVGHELGHFRGRDTDYSMRFMPIYVALDGARYQLDQEKGPADSGPALAVILTAIARYPAKALLGMLSSAFHRNVRRISRIREFEADDAATEVAEPRAVASALFKIPLYAKLWDDLVADHIARIRLGLLTPQRLSRSFDDLSRLLVTPEIAEALRKYALKSRTEHPYDSHPSSLNRAKSLGVKPASITAEELRARDTDGVAEELIPPDVLEDVEFVLTAAENHAFFLHGHIPQLPAHMGNDAPEVLYHAVYSIMAAAVRLADDPPVRFQKAVKVCTEEMTDFDRLIFAAYCRGRRKALSFDETVVRVHRSAGPEGVALLREMLAELLGEDDEAPEPDAGEILAAFDEVVGAVLQGATP